MDLSASGVPHRPGPRWPGRTKGRELRLMGRGEVRVGLVAMLAEIETLDLFLRGDPDAHRELEDQEDHGNEVPDDSLTTEDALIQEQNLIQLQTLLKMLKPMYREVLQLRYFQEMSYRDMAEQLREPLTNIKVRLLRAKKLMAELIEQNREL